MSKKIKITQLKSTIKQSENKSKILNSLGLKGRHDSVIQPDNSAIRGMIDKVNHLVKTEEVK